MAQYPRLGILISGRGSNLQAIVDAIAAGSLRAEIAAVISNNENAPGLEFARVAQIDTVVMPHRAFASRADYDRALADTLREREVDLVCLAGFMRLLSPAFIDVFPNRILNIHPSLLPAFPGLDAQRQALEHGVKITGATVHIVNAELDAGPIVLQSPVPVFDTDSAESLAERILAEEHRLYPKAIQAVLNGGWKIEGRRLIFETRAARI